MSNVELVNAILAARKGPSAALDRMFNLFMAIEASKVRSLNVDPATAVSRVLGAAPKIAEYRVELKQRMPLDDWSCILVLEDSAYAFQEAYVRWLCAGKTPEELRALLEEADEMRGRFRIDLSPLVNRGIIDPASLSMCTGQQGYKASSTELGVFVTVLTSCSAEIRGKCCITDEELQRAKAIADALLAFVGIHEQAPEHKSVAMDLRDRAFTYLVQTYEQARRGITFLRWFEGDADEIAPSLFGGKHRARKNDKGQEQDASNGANATPATTSTTPVPPTSTPSATPGASPAAPQAAGSQTGTSNNTSVGKPNSNPFMK